MNRTGVGCRVLIDGALLDDGCIDWGGIGYYGAPWTETRRNLCLNPNIETNANGWTLYGTDAIALRDTAQHHSGAASLRIGTSTAGGNKGAQTAAMPVVAGRTYTFSAWILATVGTAPTALALSWYSAGSFLSSTNMTPVALPLGTWQRVTITGVAPVGAVNCYAPVMIIGATVDDVRYVDDVLCEASTVAGVYFDGNSPDAGALRYSWLGVENSSISVMETGTWIPDQTGYVGEGVSADSGLTVTWGRDTTVDQPRASACTFRVLDDLAGVTVLDAVRIGARVDVLADAVIASGTGPSVFTDPGFDVELRATVRNATAVRSQVRADDPGGWAAQLGMITPGVASSVRFPPGPIQPPATNPGAWTGLQTVQPGETWTVAVRVYMPTGLTANLRPVLYSGPWVAAATPVTAATVPVTVTGAWTTVTVSFSPGDAQKWVGFEIDLNGGIAWNDLNPGLTWDTADPAWTWDSISTVSVDSVSITPPASGTRTTVQVFSGRVTDLDGYWDDDWQVPALTVTASDFLADLGNRYIGAEPWPVQTVATRMAQILTLAAIPGESATLIDIAPSLTGIPLTAMDVDHRAAAGMLTDIAQSVDGVLWSATHPTAGQYVRVEDPAQRLALFQLALIGGKIVIRPIDLSGMTNPPPDLSACDVLRDPVTFTMSVSDIATRADATYQEQPTPPATDVTERHVSIVKAPLEAQYGTRSVSVQTDLTTSADTLRVADQIISRLTGQWRIQGLDVSDAWVQIPNASAAALFMTLLNNITRGGQPLILSDLDAWSPVGESAPIYLEGGRYVFDRGGWDLSLIVSRSTGFGQSAAWNDMPDDPAWNWDSFDPVVTWDSLRGVAGP